MKDLKTRLGELLLALLLFVALCFVMSFVTYKYYHWFVLSVFPTVNLTFLQLVGLNMFVAILKGGTNRNYYYDGVQIKSKIDYASIVLYPLVTLSCGYLIHLLIS